MSASAMDVPTRCDLEDLRVAVESFLIALRTHRRDHSKISDAAWAVVRTLRGPDGYDTISTGWNYLDPAGRQRLRRLHDALCGSQGTHYVVTHPEAVDELARRALKLARPAATAQAAPNEAPAGPLDDLVTLDQAAAMVHRTKRTLDKYRTRGELPDPAVQGGRRQSSPL